MRGNALAFTLLYAWPAVVLAVYAARRGRATLARTTAWMVLLPAMFLPALLDLPFAGLNKHRIAFLSVAIALALFHPHELGARSSWRHFPLLALLVAAVGAVQTVRTNGDPLSYGPLRLPGLNDRDGLWMIYAFFVDTYLPFVIGQRVFKTERDLRDLLEVLSLCGLVYVPLCLIEIRLSPQLSNWVYGYFPHSFAQTRRGEGFRPVVFMNHGLSVAMFLFTALSAAVALRRARVAARPSAGARAWVVGVVLLLGRSLASILYSAVAGVLLVWGSGKAVARVVLVVVAVVAAYPALRTTGVVSAERVGELFEAASPERRESLVFRLSNEDQLIERAMSRPLWGWGGWGRNRVYIHWYDGWADVTVTDGTWIILLGSGGVVGLVALFAVLLLPLLRFVRAAPRIPPGSRALLEGLALIVAAAALDLLPNSQSDYLPVVYAGALFTLSDRLLRSRAPAGALEQAREPTG